MRRGDPEKVWKKVEQLLRCWETTCGPVRWSPWRDVFWGREGLYVLLRGVVLALCLAAVSWSSWGTWGGMVLRIAAIAVALGLLLEIVVTHTSIAFVTRRPIDILRTAFLTICS